MGWTGRRAAWLSALGFVIVLLNFLPVSYFVTTSHTFQCRAPLPARRESPRPRPSSCASGSTSRAATSARPSRRWRRVRRRRVGRAVDLQPLGDLRRQQRSVQAREEIVAFLSEYHQLPAGRSRRTCSRSTTPRRRSTCSGSRPDSIRWSSASRRSSARSRTPSRPPPTGTAPARC